MDSLDALQRPAMLITVAASWFVASNAYLIVPTAPFVAGACNVSRKRIRL